MIETDKLVEALREGVRIQEENYGSGIGTHLALNDWAKKAQSILAEYDAQAARPRLHPATADLVSRFSVALAEKLAAAEQKYGYSDNWSRSDWMDECRQRLLDHVAKGDPRDVAAYCAFLWHHGQPTTKKTLTQLRVECEKGQAAQPCCCGEPETTNTVHRTDGPCYVQEAAQLVGVRRDIGIIARALVLSNNETTAAFNRLTARVQELERENGELRRVDNEVAGPLAVKLHERAERAEAELAAIRKRIAEAPTCNVMLRSCDPPMHAHDVVCYDEKFMDKWMRVALLPLGDEAKDSAIDTDSAEELARKAKG